MTRSPHNPILNQIALLTAVATFPLIFMGGLVTSHGAGMAVPDWPNSYGYNMFTFPPSQWVGGIWYEHVHRLYASGVGLLCIIVCAVAWRTERRPWVRWLATALLAAVIVQGVLGGLRVILVELGLAVVHACMAQAFFCLATLMAMVTSRWWVEAPDRSRQLDAAAGRRLAGLAAACVFAIYVQLIAGALMRHYDAGLAIPDLPLAYGKLLPPTDPADLRQANAIRAWESGLKPVTATQVWLHFAHRLGAIAVTAAIGALVYVVVRRHRAERALLRPALLLVGLLLLQLTLGVLTVLWRKPADVASAHVAVGALVLVTSFVIAVRAARLYAARRPATQGLAVNANDGEARPAIKRPAALAAGAAG